ncbi:bifunctional adenosylcobinamide kinase/adenosylcobinamide-phosphate guanylyltransferase [Thalassovita mediterranea]|jgi:adenosylcobinamide kinase/adenosylcobinamide-phosphate guanylyltransferase|uniref:Bifunctional adenosylcobalamin biosynthesis protein n=1 Tax=Thalassovita mediterranea TaxID=340021 RepID=A0A0P1H7W4_9RHOB|nr:bifunctional adenosylcobinamide kinase/adenosylcobinamide-phosphate guanylyltransferase [Thalassovita mediterranea]CUH83009.1 Adenosylcobinamide kinase [Thalassovita mediterranea]SIS31254.1 adenosylcobinamide kinase /adenosylcobinamide-phosphate guanylyltransferase [Thalassovita mediterranea]
MSAGVTLVLGGAASGKSVFAENLVISSGYDRIYLATSQAWDDEMKAKIKKHIAQRGKGWTTVEAPLDLAPVLENVKKKQIVLLDCATMWLTNHLLADHDLAEQSAQLIKAIKACKGKVVIVSNEVGLSVVPENALARRFREAQGTLNQQIAAEADTVVAVMAGLPMVLKGSLEEAKA